MKKIFKNTSKGILIGFIVGFIANLIEFNNILFNAGLGALIGGFVYYITHLKR